MVEKQYLEHALYLDNVLESDLSVLEQIAEIMEENYYTLSATGNDAIEAAVEDFVNGHWENDQDNDFNNEEIASAIEYLRIKFHIEGKLGVTASHHYTHRWNQSFDKAKG